MNETQYYKNIKNKKIAIFGITPPPFGGVSIHIQRVAQKFKEQNNRVYHFKTEFRGRRYLLPVYLLYAAFFLIKNKIDIVYYHSSYLPNSMPEIRFLVWFKKFLSYDFVLVEHNCRHMYKRSPKVINKFKKSIKNIDQIVFMGCLPQKSYIDKNIEITDKCVIDNAFLPPDESQENKIVKTYPKELFTFINQKRPLLLANASILSFLNGKDVYGFDKTIRAFEKLKKEYPDIGLILALAHIGNTQYFKALLSLIKKCKLTNNIFFLTGQKELWPLLKKIDIFLRPTTCDGTSISLSEAIFFKIKVIASNVCKRPKEAIIFDIHDDDDFVNKILAAIKNKAKENINEHIKQRRCSHQRSTR